MIQPLFDYVHSDAALVLMTMAAWPRYRRPYCRFNWFVRLQPLTDMREGIAQFLLADWLVHALIAAHSFSNPASWVEMRRKWAAQSRTHWLPMHHKSSDCSPIFKIANKFHFLRCAGIRAHWKVSLCTHVCFERSANTYGRARKGKKPNFIIAQQIQMNETETMKLRTWSFSW